jgi:hypothetical protein
MEKILQEKKKRKKKKRNCTLVTYPILQRVRFFFKKILSFYRVKIMSLSGSGGRVGWRGRPVEARVARRREEMREGGRGERKAGVGGKSRDLVGFVGFQGCVWSFGSSSRKLCALEIVACRL